MSTERKGIEFFVGLFLLVGFGVVAALVVVFGRVGQGMQKQYPIRVRFPNASGLVKGSDVLLSGDRIGVASQAPRLTGEHYVVEVELLIRDSVQIPRKASFQVRSNGMLGDSYVDVVPPPQFDPGDFAQPGELITGSRTEGFGDLTSKGSEMIDTINTETLKKVSVALDEISAVTRSLNEKLLSETNLKNVEETFANLKTTTEDFSKTARDLDLMVGRTQEVVDSAKGTMKTIDGAAGDLRLVLGDFRKMSDATRLLMNKAASGDGTLGTLISDKQMAEDLKVLIANMRRSGVLFYKNRPVSEPEKPAARTPTPKKR
jgi:ABC-type transporter Mla subunit MlaD